MAYHPHDRGAGEVATPGEPVSASDTIAAVATPPGIGGIGIVRVSGPGVRALAQALLRRVPTPRHATYATFHDADGRGKIVIQYSGLDHLDQLLKKLR